MVYQYLLTKSIKSVKFFSICCGGSLRMRSKAQSNCWSVYKQEIKECLDFSRDKNIRHMQQVFCTLAMKRCVGSGGRGWGACKVFTSIGGRHYEPRRNTRCLSELSAARSFIYHQCGIIQEIAPCQHLSMEGEMALRCKTSTLIQDKAERPPLPTL